MKDKLNNIEMKIYKILGVKVFKKIVFGLHDFVTLPLTFKLSKEERKNFLYNTASNYRMKKGNGLQDLRDFKKMLFFNGSIHFLGLIYGITCIIGCMMGPLSIFSIIFHFLFACINFDCIMLQRYNYIRLNKVLKKGEKLEEIKKKKLCEELREIKSTSKEHKYILVDKKDEETNITFEEFIETATLEQLKEYKSRLSFFKMLNIDDEIDTIINEDKKQPLQIRMK